MAFEDLKRQHIGTIGGFDKDDDGMGIDVYHLMAACTCGADDHAVAHRVGLAFHKHTEDGEIVQAGTFETDGFHAAALAQLIGTAVSLGDVAAGKIEEADPKAVAEAQRKAMFEQERRYQEQKAAESSNGGD